MACRAFRDSFPFLLSFRPDSPILGAKQTVRTCLAPIKWDSNLGWARRADGCEEIWRTIKADTYSPWCSCGNIHDRTSESPPTHLSMDSFPFEDWTAHASTILQCFSPHNCSKSSSHLLRCGSRNSPTDSSMSLAEMRQRWCLDKESHIPSPNLWEQKGNSASSLTDGRKGEYEDVRGTYWSTNTTIRYKCYESMSGISFHCRRLLEDIWYRRESFVDFWKAKL